MSTMTKTGEHLLYLMACALQGVSAREEVLADADLKQLLIMARKHSVASMVCMALEKTAIFANADEATKKQWIDAKNKAIRKNMLLDAERKTILHELETQGIWYMPLKGSILKDGTRSPECGKWQTTTFCLTLPDANRCGRFFKTGATRLFLSGRAITMYTKKRPFIILKCTFPCFTGRIRN